jgi:hypothetical protein
MAFTGTYKLQNTEFYNEYLKALNVGWFQRRAACSNTRSITITEGAQGTINLKTTNGLAKQIEKTITLGEEHSELLPNGQESKGVTVREGDHSLITRLKTQKGNIEVRRDFSKEGMTQIIRLIDKDIETTLTFKRS